MNFKKYNGNKIENKSKHLKWFAVIFFVLLLALIFRLFWLQFIDGASLKEKSYKQIIANN